MRFRALLSDDTAVSPVIGVILMVAITVVLAAVIGTFVLGLGNQFQQTAPNANFQFDYDSGTLTVTHDGGDGIAADELYVDDTQWNGDTEDGMVRAGHSMQVSASEDETVRVVWRSPDGEASQTLRVWNGG